MRKTFRPHATFFHCSSWMVGLVTSVAGWHPGILKHPMICFGLLRWGSLEWLYLGSKQAARGMQRGRGVGLLWDYAGISRDERRAVRLLVHGVVPEGRDDLDPSLRGRRHYILHPPIAVMVNGEGTTTSGE